MIYLHSVYIFGVQILFIVLFINKNIEAHTTPISNNSSSSLVIIRSLSLSIISSFQVDVHIRLHPSNGSNVNLDDIMIMCVSE